MGNSQGNITEESVNSDLKYQRDEQWILRTERLGHKWVIIYGEIEGETEDVEEYGGDVEQGKEKLVIWYFVMVFINLQWWRCVLKANGGHLRKHGRMWKKHVDIDSKWEYPGQATIGKHSKY